MPAVARLPQTKATGEKRRPVPFGSKQAVRQFPQKRFAYAENVRAGKQTIEDVCAETGRTPRSVLTWCTPKVTRNTAAVAMDIDVRGQAFTAPKKPRTYGWGGLTTHLPSLCAAFSAGS